MPNKVGELIDCRTGAISVFIILIKFWNFQIESEFLQFLVELG